MNFYDGLEGHGAAPAIITEQDERLTYRELTALADELRRHLEPRRVALIACSNTVASVAGYVACLRARVVPLLVASGSSPEQIAGLISVYRPEFVWLPAGHGAAASLGATVHAMRGYALKKPEGGGDALHPDLALLLTTSGSTGSPALVRLSYANIDSNTDSIVQYLGISPSDRPITTLPMSYTYGLSIINTHLRQGATLVLTDRSVVDKVFWEMLKKHQATGFGGVPYTYEMLWKLRFPRMELPSLKALTQAGGKLAADLARDVARACEAKGIRFFVMYGQAEATARMSWLPSERAIDKAGSIGVAIPGGALWLEDADGRPVDGADVEGELTYRGPNVSMGYAYTRVDLAKGDENHGVLRTGDLAKRDADGFFYITGRRKRFLKLFGNRVNLDDIEQVLTTLGFECACSGVDDHLRVYATSADTEAHATIRRVLSERTGIHPSAFDVTHVARIPRNESGKVIYPALAQ